MMRGTRKGKAFSQAVSKPIPKGPETSPWYWNPNRVGAREAPAWFQARLREVDPDGLVDIRWNPVSQRWQAFYRNPKINRQVCSGWQLLFIIEDPTDHTYMPLDERTLAVLYQASARRWGSGKAYFHAIEREMERDRERTERRQKQEAVDLAMPAFEHSQISVAMRGRSNGSKFSTYHA